MLVSISILTESEWLTHEKDEQEVIIYTAEGIDHYIISNLGDVNIVWVKDNLECSIAGDIFVSDAEKIIDSIYRRH